MKVTITGSELKLLHFSC